MTADLDQSPRHRLTDLCRDRAAFRQAVLALVPEGTAITEAKERMEREGFTCTYTINPNLSAPLMLTFLDCHWSSSERPLCAGEWPASCWASFRYENGTVTRLWG
jgi:hypothetical protein